MQKIISTTYRIRLLGLVCLLALSALSHLLVPSFFYPLFPETFPYKTFLIIVTGPLELLLAYGLYRPKTRKLYSRLTALWFTLLTPFHFNMAINPTSFLGIKEESLPLFLWCRFFLQFVFIFWAYSIKPSKKPKKKTLSNHFELPH